MELALGIIGGVIVTAALGAVLWRFSRTDTSQVAGDLASAHLSLAEAETRLRSETERADTLAHERDDTREQVRLHADELAQTRLARTEAETRLKSETERADTLTRERDAAREEARTREGELAQARAEVARLTADSQARMEEINKARAELDLKFKGIADEVMRASNENFLKQANAQFEAREQAIQHLVDPVGKDLEKLQKHIGEIEKSRSGADANIQTLITEMGKQMSSLRTETSHLASALQAPRVRGSWGEHLLENIFEMADMHEGTDYHKQVTLKTDNGQSRPDFIVSVPGNLKIVIDSKTPWENYYRAHETEDAQKQSELLRKHAESLTNHARDLKRKDYSRFVEGGLDMVVLFVPADAILDAAMRADPSVWENAWGAGKERRILIATPSTMIALLHTIVAAWKRVEVQRDAEKIAEAAKELHDQIKRYAEHVGKVGKGLEQAVKAYNSSIGSYNKLLQPPVRRVENLAISEARQIEAPKTIEVTPRLLLWEDEEEDE